ncbi:hypothetical protein F5Y13DRAFT_182114 [Hypoxylon sp. FL1857]|nr:hypothetical protein F5Y13DRAFT_182114 [Hypoxylon sp. FL1857]
MGWVYNTPEDTATEGPSIAAIAISFNLFSLLLVCLRTYVRIWIVKGFGHETKYGLGLERQDDMPPENEYAFGLVQFIGAPFYIIGVWGFKMSLLLCYLRFFPGSYRKTILVITTFCTLGHVAFICVVLFICTPIEKQWNPYVTWGHCGNLTTYYLSSSWITVFFDLMLIGLPFPVLLKSKIRRRRKVALLILFALGLFVTGIQIVRIHMINSLADYINYARSIVWSIIECNFGIVTTSLPTLAPLFKYFSEKTRADVGSPSKKPESRYALHTWRGGGNVLGSNGDHEVRISGVSQGDSTERILDIEGIMKRMDVVVTRQKIHDSNTRDSSETIGEEQFGAVRIQIRLTWATLVCGMYENT